MPFAGFLAVLLRTTDQICFWKVSCSGRTERIIFSIPKPREIDHVSKVFRITKLNITLATTSVGTMVPTEEHAGDEWMPSLKRATLAREFEQGYLPVVGAQPGRDKQVRADVGNTAHKGESSLMMVKSSRVAKAGRPLRQFTDMLFTITWCIGSRTQNVPLSIVNHVQRVAIS